MHESVMNAHAMVAKGFVKQREVLEYSYVHD